MVSIGVLVAVCIGSMGFFYELKAADKAAAETKEKKAAALAEGTADVPVAQQQQDMDEIIRQQREQAASDAVASTVTVTTSPTATRPMLTGDDFRNDINKDPTGELAAKSDADMIYTSPIFKQNGATRNRQSSTPAIQDVITPAQMHAALQPSGSTAAEQMAVQLAKQGQAPENRDKEFLQDAATQSGIIRTTFNRRATGCTLTPPHNIHVTAVEG
ncbi:MAG: conjugal transfer protein TrbI, partial [Caballeronia sp.]